ncbi:MAG: DUF6166 domain-containing protein [Sulfurimonas sp.]|nr:DUF6166 domain-containing protein [Sulfurimonas sp.]
MGNNRNNYAFKGHRALLGSRFVTYAELELPLRYDLYNESNNNFDWGHAGPSSKQLAFSMLFQLSNQEFARNNVINFTNEVVAKLTSRDWILSAADVINWIRKNSNIKLEDEELLEPQNRSLLQAQKNVRRLKLKPKINVVKEVCNELHITQKNLAKILEIPEGTVSSWAVKNEIPRLGKKAIEFYIEKQKNQHIIDSYKSFVKLLNVS